MRKMTLLATVFGFTVAATAAQAETNKMDDSTTYWVETTTNETPNISEENLWDAAEADQGFNNVYSRHDVVGSGAPHPLFIDYKIEVPKVAEVVPEPPRQQVAAVEPTPKVEPHIPTVTEEVVFFDFDVAELRPMEQAKLAEIAKQARDGATFRLEGHADRAGALGYNNELSRYRVMNAAEALSTYGVTANQIEMNWEGETDPAVPTPDGEREQLNRRVELKIIQ